MLPETKIQKRKKSPGTSPGRRPRARVVLVASPFQLKRLVSRCIGVSLPSLRGKGNGLAVLVDQKGTRRYYLKKTLLNLIHSSRAPFHVPPSEVALLTARAPPEPTRRGNKEELFVEDVLDLLEAPEEEITQGEVDEVLRMLL